MSFAKASQHLSKDELGKIQKMKVDPRLEKRRKEKFIDSPFIMQNLKLPLVSYFESCTNLFPLRKKYTRRF